MNNMFNIMQIMSNPQAFLQNVVNNTQIMQNPMVQSAFQMAQKGDSKGLENLAQNICKTNGKDITDFKNKFGIR